MQVEIRLPAPGGSAGVRPGHVLLVEDEPVILQTLKRALELSGRRVTAVPGGREALSVIDEAAPFDAVITDVNLESGSGLDVLRRAKEKDPDSAVIVITGYSAERSALDALRFGADEYLAKPFDYGEMLLRVTRCLERRELARKVRLYERLLGVCSACGSVPDDDGGRAAPEELAARLPPEPVLCGKCSALQGPS